MTTGSLAIEALRIGATRIAATRSCPSVPALAYSPMVVGWDTLILCALGLAAGVACVGVVGSLLRWTTDDVAPLRPVWMGMIALGFVASSTGLYVARANQVHANAVNVWLLRASRACLSVAARSANLTASSTGFSLQLGVLALALIGLGAAGAVWEWRLSRKRTPR
jgi:hypothetical protein